MRILITSVLGFLLAASPVFAGLTWEATEVSTDAAPGEKVVTIRYPFTNSGTTPVEIKGIRAGCNCTTVQTEKLLYQPGEKGELVALFEIGKRTGTQKKRVTVTTDDKVKETLRFTVRIP